MKTLTAHVDGSAFQLPRTTYVTDSPLTRDMAEGLIPSGVEIVWCDMACWFGKAGWLDGRALVIPLREDEL